MSMGDFDWAAVWYAIPYMLKEAFVTLEISMGAMAIGLAMGLIRASNLRIPKSHHPRICLFRTRNADVGPDIPGLFPTPSYWIRTVAVLERGCSTITSRR
jgi:ABC-type amino acid transport system permease subunit